MLITSELNQESVKWLLFVLHYSSMQRERKYLFIVSSLCLWIQGQILLIKCLVRRACLVSFNPVMSVRVETICVEKHPAIWLVYVSLFSVGSTSDLQREAVISALSALSVFKLQLISLYVPPTFRSTLNVDDYHYSRQRHLSRRNKFGFFISVIILL